MTTIIGINLGNRMNHSTALQEVLTQFGCIIKTRLGLHDVSGGKCPINGIILLEVIDDNKTDDMITALKAIEEIEIQTMKFV